MGNTSYNALHTGVKVTDYIEPQSRHCSIPRCVHLTIMPEHLT